MLFDFGLDFLEENGTLRCSSVRFGTSFFEFIFVLPSPSSSLQNETKMFIKSVN